MLLVIDINRYNFFNKTSQLLTGIISKISIHVCAVFTKSA